MNRLSQEKSPYLQMHRDNPVNWYPWCAEAFAAARAEDKPVFLSIGYSSCHWCHVIARESFEDRVVAAMLNESYVSVKVDKEERPDVDAVYMDAVQLTTGSGGWPMTILMTPDGAPFFAATYLPKESRDGMMGLKELLSAATKLWREERERVLAAAEALTRRMRALANRPVTPREPSHELTEEAVRAFEANYDARWGGFGDAPKFPAAHDLLFLLSHYERTGDERAREMVEGTLAGMARGGLFDHVGGGFCRYSTDRKWLTPHFEKMLYDNALLLWIYAQAWRSLRKPLYRHVAERTADYVLREMTGPEGAFCCSQDADSAGKEGAYYVFARDELMTLLGEADGARFCDAYGIARGGNFGGASIPNRIGKSALPEDDDALRPLRERVYQYRARRLPLARDDKVLTSWNALMIASLCEAARALNAPQYLEAARKAEAFLRAHLVKDDGELMLRCLGGEAKGAGVFVDYACYALALTELHAATGETDYLRRAEEWASRFAERFADADGGGYFLYSDRGETLITRPKELWDGAMPSGNACAALALWQLAEQTGDAPWREAARRQLRFVAGAAAESPTGHGFGLLAIERALPREAVVQR